MSSVIKIRKHHLNIYLFSIQLNIERITPVRRLKSDPNVNSARHKAPLHLLNLITTIALTLVACDTTDQPSAGTDTSADMSQGGEEGGASAGVDVAGVSLAGMSSAGMDSAGMDSAGADSAGMNSSGMDTAGADSAGTDSAGMDSAGTDTAGTDTTGMDSAGTDTAGADSAGTDSAGTDTAGMSGGEVAGADDLPDLELTSGVFTITQSWSQETDYERQVHVYVPSGDQVRPVVILLHGAGGNGQGHLRFQSFLTEQILVAPDGYLNFWNCGAEMSKAPDIDLIRSIITHLKRHRNVDANNISVLGTSNGSALTNRLLIELEDDTFQRAVTIVSPMNNTQFHDGQFYADPENLNQAVSPVMGRRILNIGGTADPVIPYEGGVGVAGYQFLSGEYSTYLWARHMGYQGEQLTEGVPSETDPQLVAYSYLDGAVTHYKVIDGNHGLFRDSAVRSVVARFLSEAESVSP